MQNPYPIYQKPNQIHSESIKNPTKPWRIYQIHIISYHDPSHRVPGIFYWNADHPLKKKGKFSKIKGGWLLLGSQHYPLFSDRPMSLTQSNLTLGGSPSGISDLNPPKRMEENGFV